MYQLGALGFHGLGCRRGLVGPGRVPPFGFISSWAAGLALPVTVAEAAGSARAPRWQRDHGALRMALALHGDDRATMRQVRSGALGPAAFNLLARCHCQCQLPVTVPDLPVTWPVLVAKGQRS